MRDSSSTNRITMSTTSDVNALATDRDEGGHELNETELDAAAVNVRDATPRHRPMKERRHRR